MLIFRLDANTALNGNVMNTVSKLPFAHEIVHQQYCRPGRPFAYVPLYSQAPAQSSHHNLQTQFQPQTPNVLRSKFFL